MEEDKYIYKNCYINVNFYKMIYKLRFKNQTILVIYGRLFK